MPSLEDSSRIADTDDNFLVHQICNLDEHVGFLDLVGNFVNHDALAFVVVEHLALCANMEAAFPVAYISAMPSIP